MESICPTCGQKFIRTHNAHKYCSRACRPSKIKLQKQEVILACPVCLKDFVPMRGNQKYCSDECRDKANARFARHAVRNQPKPAREFPQRKCKYCGGTFTPRNNRQVYCSLVCRYAKNARIRQEREKRAREENKITISCRCCGKDFKATHRSQLYCSDECRKIARLASRKPQHPCPVCKRRTTKGVYCCAACRDKDIEAKKKTVNTPIRFDAGFFAMTTPEGVPAVSTSFCPMG